MCYYRHCTNVTEFLICYMRAQLLIASDSATPQTVAHQAPLSMGFPRQEYWSGLPFPPPGHLPDSGIKPMCPAPLALVSRFFTAASPGKPFLICYI